MKDTIELWKRYETNSRFS